MGDQDGAGAARLEDLAHLVAEAAAQLDVEVGEGLVEQQQARLRRQRAGQGHALLLAAGQFMGIALAQGAEIDQLEHLGGDALALGVLADAEGDVLGHRQVREQRVVLEHHADAALFRGEGVAGAGNHLAGQLDAALLHGFEAGDGAQGGGLAAARGAEQAADVAGIQVQTDVLHHPLCLVAADQIAQVEQQVVGHRALPD
ncbi:hypothetical protein D3C78_1117860 [compost metagenome]